MKTLCDGARVAMTWPVVLKLLRLAVPAVGLVVLGTAQQARATTTGPSRTTVGSIQLNWGGVSGSTGSQSYNFDGTDTGTGTDNDSGTLETITQSNAMPGSRSPQDPLPLNVSDITVDVSKWFKNGDPVSMSAVTLTSSNAGDSGSVTLTFSNVSLINVPTTTNPNASNATGTLEGTLTTSDPKGLADYDFTPLINTAFSLPYKGVHVSGSTPTTLDGVVDFIDPNNGGGTLTDPVPEPASLVLFGIGGLGFACYGWRRRHKA